MLTGDGSLESPKQSTNSPSGGHLGIIPGEEGIHQLAAITLDDDACGDPSKIK